MLKSLLPLLVIAQTVASGPVYTQSITTPSGIVQMKTSAQQLTCPGKPDIWLVGAVHVGSKEYYTSLQALLDKQELVMYEGVRGKDVPAQPQKTNADKAKPIYNVLSDALGLEFQLNAINYSRPNWKNVDMTWQELDKVSKEAGVDPNSAANYDQIKKILDPNSPESKMFTNLIQTSTPGTKEAIKLMIVRDVASGNATLDAKTQKIIIQARNKVVLDSIASTLSSEKPPKSIAVFYGALHLAAMETSLVKNYGYHLGKQQWFLAADADPSKVDATGKMLLDMAEQRKKGGG